MAVFTDNELESLAINAMARPSEAGNSATMKLGLGTNLHKDGTVYYTTNANNSGYTVGLFQWDFSAKDEASSQGLIDKYNNWAKKNGRDLIDDVASSVSLLRQGGHVYEYRNNKIVHNKNPLEGKQDLRETELGKKLDKFIASSEGYKYVFSLQERQYRESIKPLLRKVCNTPALKNMTKEDANIVLTIYAKVVNQTGHVYRVDRKNAHGGFILNKKGNREKININKPLPIMTTNPHATKDEIITALKNEHIHEKKHNVIHSIEAAEKGANFYNTLSKDSGLLGKIFSKQMALDPTLSKFDFKINPEEQMLDAMFRNPDAAQKLIHAYNNGSAYQIDNHNGAIKDEAYTIGVTKEGQIYSVDKTGKGFYIEHDSKEWHKLNNLQDLGVSFTHHQHSNHNNKQQASPVAALPDNLSKQLAELKDFAYPNPGINKQYNTAQIDNICASALNKLCARGNQNQELLDIAITQDYKEITVYYNNRLGNENSISLDANMAASIPHDQTVAQLEKTINQHLTEQQNLEQQRNQSHGPRTV